MKNMNTDLPIREGGCPKHGLVFFLPPDPDKPTKLGFAGEREAIPAKFMLPCGCVWTWTEGHDIGLYGKEKP